MTPLDSATASAQWARGKRRMPRPPRARYRCGALPVLGWFQGPPLRESPGAHPGSVRRLGRSQPLTRNEKVKGSIPFLGSKVLGGAWSGPLECERVVSASARPPRLTAAADPRRVGQLRPLASAGSRGPVDRDRLVNVALPITGVAPRTVTGPAE